MALIDSKELAKYAWSNPDVIVDGEGYISPFTVENFAEEHSIDAAQVRHGRWIWSPEYCKWICSACGGREGECETPICKWCGARMDGGDL